MSLWVDIKILFGQQTVHYLKLCPSHNELNFCRQYFLKYSFESILRNYENISWSKNLMLIQMMIMMTIWCFTSLSTLFKSYLNDERLCAMKCRTNVKKTYDANFAISQMEAFYSHLLLSRSSRDSLKYFKIYVPRHIRFAELRKKITKQSNGHISQMNM